MVQYAAVHAAARNKRKRAASGNDTAQRRLDLAQQRKQAKEQRKALVKKYDKDKNGQLEREELKKLLIEDSKMEVSDQDVEYYFIRFDRSQSGGITPEEIESLLASFHAYVQTKPQAEEFMAKYDVSKDGFLSKEELKQLMTDLNDGKPVADTEVEGVMQSADMLKHEKLEKPDLMRAIAFWDSQIDDRKSVGCCVCM